MSLENYSANAATLEFSTGEALLEICDKMKLPIYEVMIQREMFRTGLSRERIFNEMRENLSVMVNSATEGIENKQDSVTGLTGGDAKLMREYANKSYCGELICYAVAAAMGVVEVNSSMGKIVAAPTAGSSGVIPGCLLAAKKRFGFSDDMLVNALFTSAGVGIVIAENATLAGAKGGCQAEVGAASAMGAAALCELKEAKPEVSLNAAAIALKNVMGLVCDPVAGLVECPCIKRNAIGVTNALLAADMSLSGINSLIPFDEVVVAMKSVGRQMNVDLKETAKGGIAATPTGKEIMRSVRG